MTTTSRTTNTSSRRINARRLGLRESIDLPLLVIVITLFAIGLLMIYSASWQYASVQGFSEYRTVLRQFAIGLVGFALIGLLTFIDYREYERFVVLGMVVIIALSLLVLIAGTETQFGARRGLLGGSIQPSEFAKLAIIIYLSFWLNNKSDSLHKTTYGLFPLLAIVGGTAGLVLMQPDISAAATIVFLGGLMFYIAGGKMSQILAVVLATGFLGFLMAKLSSTASTRLSDYWNGLQNPQTASDHVKWSLEAIVNGGLFGVGIGRSTTKFIGLPVATTDSIFAVITEETGLIGAFIIIALYIGLLWRGITIANQAPDNLGKWLASGITLWIFLEAVINIGVLVNLLPFAGNALPLISSGGSSLITTLAAIGILMSIYRQSKIAKIYAERNPRDAVVNLRGRDRRRSVPRNGDPASSR
ncbi:MAG: cell division protein FtsW [Anaerolineaceae bacterium]|nr:cell division protein FtsW [Anaerolineaceae bacterium]